MGFKPIFKRPEDEISKKVEDKVRTEINKKVISEVDEKVKARVEGVKTEIGTRVEERFKEEGEKVRSDIDNKVKVEVEARVLAILKEKEDKDKSDKANKIAKAVDVAKALKGESDIDKEKAVAEKEKAIAAEKERAEKDMSCPGCHVGHLHKMEQTGLTVKCVGEKCGKEYVLLDTSSDYKCQTCGIPLKRPEDPKAMDGCPFCRGTKAIKFDWDKIRKVVAKK